MKFPQYRKYKNNLSYFLIHNREHFTEYKKQRNGWEKIEIHAKILPDRVYIADMLEDNSPYWDVLGEEEFSNFVKKIDG